MSSVEIKVAITAALASLHMEFPKMQTKNGYKTIERRKGISSAGVGPMTCTDAWKERMKKDQDQVVKAFTGLATEIKKNGYAYSHDVCDLEITVPLDEKTNRVICFSWTTHPAYSGGMGYDRDYRNYYFMYSARDEKVAK